MEIDLMIEHAAQLVTCASDGPKRGAAMGTVAIIHDGAVAVHKGQIVAVGRTDELGKKVQPRRRINAQRKVVLPGFVDPHTHVVYVGDRVDEFELRVRGASYTEIMAAGGGILSTMRATRQATPEQLAAEARPRLDTMLRLGTTTVEVKSGYGLTTDSELAMLQAIELLDQTHPLDLIPTFLGAHAIPPEYSNDSDGYVALVIEEMLPCVCDWYAASPLAAKGRPLFNDVFCEQHAFDLAQSRRVLEAGQARGLPAKIHADEFTSLGGVELAVELGAASADHLDVTPAHERERIAQSDTVGVVLPTVNFNLGSHHFADARALIDAGAALALSTDINPGSSPCPSMPLVMAIACRYQRLLPAEALNAATINAAYAIGMGKTVGSIEVGKQADLLLIDVPDYRHLAYQFGGNLVQTVIKQGQIV
ncbi:MAG: imidazolonepropionase [Chloroflexi bacterium AL-W]|nr:imidazolonepropionase [Chloroflexi bacterium AL-N1]NOK69315.1 imidazolonepropionase [Chloroflexi bacterium AL-N10]NOK76376.1 imidazolonepropionase [Chloroflexi bacterium AL-N5]NOK83493.1 imidazolonepropionase [Chloroflexi bacterium AL-W]NOK91153.1 imidazolonepropionase [Chloroflexi bacterium AL-N15]